jgi:hypothetical protein
VPACVLDVRIDESILCVCLLLVFHIIFFAGVGSDSFPTFVCVKEPRFGGNKQTTKIARNNRKFSLRRTANVACSKFRGWRLK